MLCDYYCLSWLLVYRTEKYKKLQAEVDKQTKRLEKQRDSTMETNIDKATKKRLEKQEEKLKNFNRDLSLVKMKSMFAIGVIFTALFSVFNHTFDGRVVARLPFVPISWLQNLSHRNLPGTDYTDCSFIFLYILCTMSIRQVIFKIGRRRLTRPKPPPLSQVRHLLPTRNPNNA
ncbi:unnamed protein product [Dibothriocephalus latus]|uniref:Calcium load-activated calcium channel n=1 Tax=Dibothriocephalus latus TaxID=60516 RepID=A0A3P6PC48_DIBLA|nr:unnamed protein product [Dibothriocephalus latus]